MRPRMPHAYSKGDLRVAPIIDADSGGIATKRSLPVGADDKRSVQRKTVFQFDRYCGCLRRDGAGFVFDNLQCRQGMHTPFERFDQIAILNVIAEGSEFDFTALNLTSRAPQPAGTSTMRIFRGAHAAQYPTRPGFPCGDGTRQQGGGAAVVFPVVSPPAPW